MKQQQQGQQMSKWKGIFNWHQLQRMSVKKGVNSLFEFESGDVLGLLFM